MKDERKLAGANYLINFFNELNQLNFSYSQYINLLIEVKSKYGTDPKPEAMSEIEKQTVANITQNVRHYCHMIFIEYMSIFSSDRLKDSINTNIEKNYNLIVSEFQIQTTVLKQYVIDLNAAMINDVIKDLLVSSQDIISEVIK